MTDSGPSNPLNAYIIAQSRNNCWSNHRLLNACAGLSEAEYFAKRSSFFGSIHDHLDHIVYVEWLYMERLTGTSYLPNEVGELLHNALAPLAKDQLAADRELIDFCQNATPDILDAKVTFQIANGREFTEAVIQVLAHLFTHQIHHRGQVHDMLSATFVAPPQLDEFFMSADLSLREAELKYLGLPIE